MNIIIGLIILSIAVIWIAAHFYRILPEWCETPIIFTAIILEAFIIISIIGAAASMCVAANGM